MIRRLLFFAWCCIATFTSFSQAEEENSYYRESCIGLNLNTNGGLIGGIVARMAFRVNERKFNVAYLELVNVKHHKEQRYASPATGNGFIAGKINYLFSLRPQFCKEYLLFNKYSEDGVQVSFLFGGGPSIGFIKPYYIEYDYTNYSNPLAVTDYRIEAYNPEIHNNANRILGAGGALYGFNKMNLIMGLNFKSGLNLEFGKYNDTVFGVEAGFSFEVYAKPIELYPIKTNPNSFSSVYLILYIGTRN